MRATDRLAASAPRPAHRPLAALALAAMLTGCAVDAALDPPVVVRGDVSGPRPTGWWRDYCSRGELVPQLPGSTECWNHGGEIYRVRVTGIVRADGTPVRGSLVAAFPGHALPRSYMWSGCLYLERAPRNFSAETSIEWLASNRFQAPSCGLIAPP